MLPILTMMGRRVLHTGPLGSASVLKVVTNYLASLHLIGIGEAFAVAHAAGMDMTTTYEAIRISSGNSFVHETEGQVILNGSYDINFTMDLVQKDMGLFLEVANRSGLALDVGPQLLEIFDEAAEQLRQPCPQPDGRAADGGTARDRVPRARIPSRDGRRRTGGTRLRGASRAGGPGRD